MQTRCDVRFALRNAGLQLFRPGRVMGVNEPTPVQTHPRSRAVRSSSRSSCVPIKIWSSRPPPAWLETMRRRRTSPRKSSSRRTSTSIICAGSETAGGWLKTVATNLSLNYLTRYRKRWRLFSEERERTRPAAARWSARLPRRGCSSAPHSKRPCAACPSISACRWFFTISRICRMRDISAKLGISLAKVKTDIRRGRAALAPMLRLRGIEGGS